MSAYISHVSYSSCASYYDLEALIIDLYGGRIRVSLTCFSYVMFPLYYYITVSKRIIDLHGGHVGVYSPGEGRGSTFFFDVPVVDMRSIAAPPLVEVPSPRATGNKVDAIQLDSSGKSLLERKRAYTVSSSTVYVEEGVASTKETQRGRGLIAGTTRTNSLVDRTRDRSSDYDTNLRTWSEKLTPRGPGSRLRSFDESKTSAHLSILLVDDASSNRKMVRRLLDKSLFTPDEAEDGSVAVSKVTQMVERGEAPYDVILMDFLMPKMDGPTATRAIRGLGYRGIVIGITGTSSPQDLEIFSASGADLVMTKPLDIDLLVTNIQSMWLCYSLA